MSHEGNIWNADMLRDRELNVDADQFPKAENADADTVRKPDAEGGRLIERLMHVSKIFRILEGSRLARLGLYSGQDQFLLALDPAAPTTNSNLARRLGVTPSTVSKMAERMVEASLVRRNSDPIDHRRALLFLTRKGSGVRADVLALREETEAELEKAFGTERTAEIARALRIMSSAIQRRLSRVR